MIRRLLIYVLLLALPNCIGGDGWAVSTKAQEPDASAAYVDSGLHVIVAVQGHVGVKRRGWSNYAPAMFGTSLRRGDLLRLEELSHVKVVCAGLTISDATRGISGVPCPAAKPVLRYRGDLAIQTRGYKSVSFPVVISPRRTKLLNQHPTLRWTPIEGATNYRVIVRGGDLNWSTEVDSNTRLVYPENAPGLKARDAYKLIVIANNGRRSDEEAEPGLGFTVLTADEAKEVRRDEQRIRELGLPDVPTRLLIVYLYTAHGLYAESIDRLEELSQPLQEPAPARLLGDLYLAVGLSRAAETRYLLALELSKKANDVEGQALGHEALGRIYESLGNRDQVTKHLKSALESFKQVGDQRTVAQIEERLAMWKR
ncbi:MAG TPA: hypothetical protein VKN18_31685 [Blastocatellia bacterium]|nr:hypothetical protein [Blastocatellia bacterium]